MTEYREFQRWATETAARLTAESGRPRLLPFLTQLQTLNDELLEVCDAVAEFGKGSAWELPFKLRRYARLLPDPMRRVRARLREIRERYRE
jgi:hypothetical protein